MRKKILITFGPCAVKIDKVRFILNTSTGELGKKILKEILKRKNIQVDCLVFKDLIKKNRNIHTLEYFFFEEFKVLFLKLLKKKKYDIIIHLSALPDFKVEKVCKGKLDSTKSLMLRLIPLEKLIDKIRNLQKNALICGFKLDFSKDILKKSLKLKKRAELDIVVANTYRNNKYWAMIINKKEQFLGPFRSKKNLAKNLAKIIFKKNINL